MRFRAQTLGWVWSTQYGWPNMNGVHEFIFQILCQSGLDFRFSLSFCLSSTSKLPQAIRLSRAFLRLHYLISSTYWTCWPRWYMISTKNFTPNYVRGLCLKSWLRSRDNPEDFHAVQRVELSLCGLIWNWNRQYLTSTFYEMNQ